MTLLAHLSDLHLLERDHADRVGLARRRLQIMHIGFEADAEMRLQRSVAALTMARRAADHLVLTGDVTEDGASGQFEVLGEALQASGWDLSHVTVVPGNHDGYTTIGAFERALRGPLCGCHSPTDGPLVLDDLVIVPQSTMIEDRPFPLAGGRIQLEDLAKLRLVIASNPGIPIVIAQHHPPFHNDYPMFEWFDGTENATRLYDLLIEHPALHVLHGHVHEKSTVTLFDRPSPQIMSVASVREQPLELALRFYEPKAASIVPRFLVV
jgi:3',5'-cyclic AMP phosphodiesterase CpdA